MFSIKSLFSGFPSKFSTIGVCTYTFEASTGPEIDRENELYNKKIFIYLFTF